MFTEVGKTCLHRVGNEYSYSCRVDKKCLLRVGKACLLRRSEIHFFQHLNKASPDFCGQVAI